MSEPPASIPPKKPRLALLIATGFGLGYIPKAPGTAGSLAGISLVWMLCQLIPSGIAFHSPSMTAAYFRGVHLVASFFLALIGIWAAGRAARHLGAKDPQAIIIDEVSGQLLTFIGSAPTLDVLFVDLRFSDPADLPWLTPVNWKYLLLGFILFRAFDIWKPFPVRQAEKLPGGWGIMADDWVAGLYAAAGLWLARALGM